MKFGVFLKFTSYLFPLPASLYVEFIYYNLWQISFTKELKNYQ